MAGKKRGQNKPSQKVQTPAPSTSLPAPTQAEIDKNQDRRITLTQVAAAISILLNFVLAYLAYSSARSSDISAKAAVEANAMNQAAQDRAAGKVKARFEFVDEKQDPNRFKEFMRKQDGYDQTVFRIESADELLQWSPHITIRNTGTEPIDAIKTDVNYIVGSVYGEGVKQIYPVPIVYNEVSSHEATTFGKLMPGQTAKIGIAPLLMNHISRLKWADFAEKDHFGIFSVNVYCRLVGAGSYDRLEDKKSWVFEFHWRPSGFKSDAKNVKELLELKPTIDIR